MKLLSAEESRLLDRLSQEKFGIPSFALMGRAGEAVAQAVIRRWPDALAAGVLVVAGKGNNGGDGMVAAKRLKEGGAKVRAVLFARATELTGDAARACREFLESGGEVRELIDEGLLAAAFDPRPALVIDAVFGTGLNAPVRGLARRALEAIDSLGVPVVAVDIASGVNADTGALMGAAVTASLTVTFGLAKFGHVSYPGAERCGGLEVAEIGFAPQALAEVGTRGRWLERAEVRPLIRPRTANSHKGMFGHPLIIAASRGKGGAALLAARGALRMGAGLVTAAIPDSVAGVVASGQAELMTEPMPEREGHFDAAGTITRLAALIAGKDALIVGPGIGVSEDTQRLLAFLVSDGARPERPLLIDADGLNVVAELGCDTLAKARGLVVLTPHPGEMARLLGLTSAAVNADRITAARRLCERAGAFVLLKGAASVIAGPEGQVYINSSGNPGMGTPGMGDALSGMLGALLGQRMPPLEALALGVFVHGFAADRVAHARGAVGYLTGDVIEDLPAALAALAS